MLTVTGLRRGRWALRIEGEDVGTFGRDELEAGLNLAALPTPMARQAAAVHALTLKHNNIHFVRWRQVQLPLEADAVIQRDAALQALDALETELIGKQRATAQPVTRRYELVLVAE